jgi:hypothetical protein
MITEPKYEFRKKNDFLFNEQQVIHNNLLKGIMPKKKQSWST